MATKPRKESSANGQGSQGNAKPAAAVPETLAKKSPSASKPVKPVRPAQPAPVETPAEATESTTARKPSRRKAPSKPELRDLVRTAEERSKELPALPSLAGTENREKESRPVDSSVPPPPVPVPDPSPSGFVDRGAPIPEHYGMDRLVAMPRDEHWVFVYWELKGGSLERLRFQHSAEVIDGARWVLRVRSLSDSNYYMVDIDLRVGQWYLKTTPGTRMSLELGLIDHNGDFVNVIGGHEVRTPKAQVSEVLDERWIIKREELEGLIKVSGITAGPQIQSTPGSRGGVPSLVRTEQPRTLSLFSSFLARHAAPPPEEKK